MTPRQLTVFISWKNRLWAQHTLFPGDYILGEDGTDIVLPAPESAKMRLSVTNHEIFVEDLAGTIATFVNKRPVRGRTRIFLTQTLYVGENVEMKFQRQPTAFTGEESLSPQSAAVYRLLPEPLRTRKYEIDDVVARGGMGTVLSAQEKPLQRKVAMKVMRNAASESSMARFIAEARLTGQLEHPNIIPIHEFGVDEEDQLYYTMKFVRGCTLQQIIAGLRERSPEITANYPLARLLGIFQKICDAMAFAHSRGIIHRDLKPENVMLGEYGEVLVMDWGLAKALQPGSPQRAAEQNCGIRLPAEISPAPEFGWTQDGEIVGTPHYMSPEQARGEISGLNARTDIYSLGAILFAILHHQPPVTGASPHEILEKLRGAPPHSSARSDPLHAPADTAKAPRALCAVALKAMSPADADRYESVTALQADITAYQNGFATRAEVPHVGRLLLLALRRHKNQAALVAVSLLALATGGIFAFNRISREWRRAEFALTELRGSAPVFASQAGALISQERYEEAADKLDYALKLCPGSFEFLLAKADLLQCQFHFKEAAGVYGLAAAANPQSRRAEENYRFTEELGNAMTADGGSSRENLFRLFERMKADGRPAAEMLPVSRKLGLDRNLARKVWLERLGQLPFVMSPPLEKRLGVERDDGLLSLDLSHTPVASLELLAGMPLGALSLEGCSTITSIEALRGLPLRSLVLDGTQVSDLRPLKDSPLSVLSIRNAPVMHLGCLASLQLAELDCSGIPAVDYSDLVSTSLSKLILNACHPLDLAFLSGMPLKTLSLSGCGDARNYRSLTTLTALQTLVLPENFHALPEADLKVLLELRNHPSLLNLDIDPSGNKNSSTARPAAFFWEQWEKQLLWLANLAGTGFASRVARLEDNTWEVEFRYQPISDISCLRGAAISRLILFHTEVTDLKPLAGLPLVYLDLRESPLSDLTPIQNMPLKALLLWKTNVVNHSVISTLPELEFLDVAETPLADLSIIKSRNLKVLRIGHTRVTDFTPLEGMALETLHADSIDVVDFRPLLKCPALKFLILPEGDGDPGILRTMRSLERISYTFESESRPSMTAAEFWKEYDRNPTFPYPKLPR